VHVFVGNGQGMGSIPWAANDPIFWMHHCNIDRIWTSWNATGHVNPTTAAWLGKVFVFAGPDGKGVKEVVKDYTNTQKAPWEYPHRGGRTKAMEADYPVLKRDYPLNEKNLEWWANEKDSPYTEVKRFDWYRGYHVGGRSLTWGRQSYRLSDLDFEANAKEGIAIDWPIRYADLAPWYDHVERFAGVAGSVEGLPQLPDGQFQPAMPLNVAEERTAGRLAKQFGGRRRLIPGRVANLTRPLAGHFEPIVTDSGGSTMLKTIS